MASVNKAIIVGFLGNDPKTKTFPSGDKMTTISVATTDKWIDKQTGEKREATEWHVITFTGPLASIADQYLRKGSQVYVEGSIHTRKWKDKEGQERYSTEIRATQLQMLGSRQGKGQTDGDDNGGYDDGYGAPAPAAPRRAPAPVAATPRATRASPPKASSGFDDMDDDIPF